MKKINISNVKALQLFHLIRYGAFLLIGILLSKSDFGKTNIGNYETFLLIAGAFTFFWVNGFLKVMMPLSSEKNDTEKKILVFNTFVLLSFFATVAAVFVLFLNQPISNFLINGNEIPMPLLLALYIFVNSPALMIEYTYLANNKSKSIIIYAIIIFTLQVVAVGLPPFWGYGIKTIIWALASISILKYIWLITVLVKYSTA
ncbi:MAG: hypothetical protein PF541_14950 [Prolixibacteraceae bacterium]|nr:hypothetical protein [Prolixibacteraceae bacterium]